MLTFKYNKNVFYSNYTNNAYWWPGVVADACKFPFAVEGEDHWLQEMKTFPDRWGITVLCRSAHRTCSYDMDEGTKTGTLWCQACDKPVRFWPNCGVPYRDWWRIEEARLLQEEKLKQKLLLHEEIIKQDRLHHQQLLEAVRAVSGDVMEFCTAMSAFRGHVAAQSAPDKSTDL